MIHRDIKPKNFVVFGTRDGWFDPLNKEDVRVYLTDFGSLGLPKSGTPVYAAPEYLSDDMDESRNRK